MTEVIIVPVLRDNYTYLYVDEASKRCLIIDPPDAAPVIEALDNHSLTPEAIWLTHHHQDHIAGVPALTNHYSQLDVLCSQRDASRIPNSTRSVKEGDRVDFQGHEALVMELPGHAEGHVAFHFAQSSDLFCGDVIFGASCGAVFGDTHKEMYHSVTRVSKLAPDTKLWCGHEYTKNNLRFAEAVLGAETLAERKANFAVPSMPLLMSQEHQTNPFMNLDHKSVHEFLGLQGDEDHQGIFKALRLAKDKF